MTEEEQTEQPQDRPQKGPVLTESKIPKAQNPALFLVIVALVVCLGMIVGLFKNDNTIVETDREAVVPTTTTSERTRPVLEDMPMLDVIKQTAAGGKREARVPNSPKDVKCDFAQFVGEVYDDSVAQNIKDASTIERPYRILRPDEMYTQDYNPTRVNINLDRSNQIVKIWCG